MLLTGVDEVGVGPLAGPIVAVAITAEAPEGFDPRRPGTWWPIPGVTDSKKVSKKKRPDLFDRIQEFVHSVGGSIGVAEADARSINQLGHGEAYRRVMRQAVVRATTDVGRRSDLVVVDGHCLVGDLTLSQLAVPKADQKFFLVAAASIVAKLLRDETMERLGGDFPEYGWETNQGYGTEAHIRALQRHGSTPHHREKATRTALSSAR